MGVHMRIYTAGPMSGLPAYNAPAFAQAAEFLRSLGHHVVTPHERNAIVWLEKTGRVFDPNRDKCDYGDPMLDYMVADDLVQVCTSDTIALLPGWQKSQGGLAELHVATLLGKRVLDATTGQDRAVTFTCRGSWVTPPRTKTGRQMEFFAPDGV